MTDAPKILLATPWQRTSARGNEYLSGYLGKTRVIGFRGEPTADGTPTWNLYLQAGDRDGSQRAPNLNETTNRHSSSRSRRSAQPKSDAPAGDGRPFDDPVDDIGMAP